MIMDSKIITCADLLSLITFDKDEFKKQSVSTTWVGFGMYNGTCTPGPCSNSSRVAVKISCQWSKIPSTFDGTFKSVKEKYPELSNYIAESIAVPIFKQKYLMEESAVYKKIYDELTTDPYYDQYINNLPYIGQVNCDNYKSIPKLSSIYYKLWSKIQNDCISKELISQENLKYLSEMQPDSLHILITEQNLGIDGKKIFKPEEMKSYIFQCLVTLKILHQYSIYHTDLHPGNFFIATYNIAEDSDAENPYFEYVVNGMKFNIPKQHGIFRIFDWDHVATSFEADKMPDYLYFLQVGAFFIDLRSKYMIKRKIACDDPDIFKKGITVYNENYDASEDAFYIIYPRYVTIDELLEDVYFDNFRSTELKRKQRPIITDFDWLLTSYDIPLPDFVEVSEIIETLCSSIERLKNAQQVLFNIILFCTVYKKDLTFKTWQLLLTTYRSLNPADIELVERLIELKDFMNEV